MISVILPHDAFARRSLSKDSHARDLIKNFMPIEVQKNLDLDHLKLDPTSYVDPKFKDHQTDVLFSVPLVNKELAFVYILVADVCLMKHFLAKGCLIN